MSLFDFLNIWNLMSLDANSNICDRYGSVLSDWLFLWFIFSSLFACLIICEWMADIVNFALCVLDISVVL